MRMQDMDSVVLISAVMAILLSVAYTEAVKREAKQSRWKIMVLDLIGPAFALGAIVWLWPGIDSTGAIEGRGRVAMLTAIGIMLWGTYLFLMAARASVAQEHLNGYWVTRIPLPVAVVAVAFCSVIVITSLSRFLAEILAGLVLLYASGYSSGWWLSRRGNGLASSALPAALAAVVFVAGSYILLAPWLLGKIDEANQAFGTSMAGSGAEVSFYVLGTVAALLIVTMVIGYRTRT